MHRRAQLKHKLTAGWTLRTKYINYDGSEKVRSAIYLPNRMVDL